MKQYLRSAAALAATTALGAAAFGVLASPASAITIPSPGGAVTVDLPAADPGNTPADVPFYLEGDAGQTATVTFNAGNVPDPAGQVTLQKVAGAGSPSAAFPFTPTGGNPQTIGLSFTPGTAGRWRISVPYLTPTSTPITHTQDFEIKLASSVPVVVGNTSTPIPPFVSLTASPTVPFSAFAFSASPTTPYSSSVDLTAQSTGLNSQLTAEDLNTGANKGKLINNNGGTFTFAAPLTVDAGAASAFSDNGGPQALNTAAERVLLGSFPGPTPAAGSVVPVTFGQNVASTDVIRSGTYQATVLFTLGTPSP